ncbi:preprotein translocase subunit SecE [Arenimonas caeni]|jgi:preprotein translocase subunit SecE|uniref:Protein translocase subunit SecE n=1 Tax=Arenimonas caeni TaxID=2058085 RepID=A0A2P6M5M0_9GAMM|nr:preprotein translocase subunit SecE [Arenimonas caeni]MDY0020955.1 preprotein translocase subunit SecE [Arenimonas caeni]PRH81249.1 preprotein translocase subunit SecE [Arenimonas caeni]
MNTKAEQADQAASAADVAKYALAIALVAGGLVLYWMTDWPTLARVMLVVVGVAAGAFVMASTAKGRDAREFLGESMFELRKVVWPTRQETTRTTGVILVVVVIVSLILSGFDFIISWLIRLLLGQ